MAVLAWKNLGCLEKPRMPRLAAEQTSTQGKMRNNKRKNQEHETKAKTIVQNSRSKFKEKKSSKTIKGNNVMF